MSRGSYSGASSYTGSSGSTWFTSDTGFSSSDTSFSSSDDFPSSNASGGGTSDSKTTGLALGLFFGIPIGLLVVWFVGAVVRVRWIGGWRGKWRRRGEWCCGGRKRGGEEADGQRVFAIVETRKERRERGDGREVWYPYVRNGVKGWETRWWGKRVWLRYVRREKMWTGDEEKGQAGGGNVQVKMEGDGKEKEKEESIGSDETLTPPTSIWPRIRTTFLHPIRHLPPFRLLTPAPDTDLEKGSTASPSPITPTPSTHTSLPTHPTIQPPKSPNSPKSPNPQNAGHTGKSYTLSLLSHLRQHIHRPRILPAVWPRQRTPHPSILINGERIPTVLPPLRVERVTPLPVAREKVDGSGLRGM